jgi:dienelactone hydrolase
MATVAAASETMISDWTTTRRELQELDEIGEGPLGYWGLSMGTAFGVPFVASKPRVRCAVLGLFGLRPGAEAMAQLAAKITIPLLFMFQLNDELMTPEQGIALFTAFGSKVKSMHINPGPHVGTPLFERDYYETFYKRHLGGESHSHSG